MSVLEPHGEYNPSKEYTLNAVSQLTALQYSQQGSLTLIELTVEGLDYLVAIDSAKQATGDESQTFSYLNTSYTLTGRLGVFVRSNH